jgi:hypothetical protein
MLALLSAIERLISAAEESGAAMRAVLAQPAAAGVEVVYASLVGQRRLALSLSMLVW